MDSLYGTNDTYIFLGQRYISIIGTNASYERKLAPRRMTLLSYIKQLVKEKIIN